MKHMKEKILKKTNRVKVLATTCTIGLATLPMHVCAATPGDTTGASNIVGDVIRIIVQLGGGLAGAVFIIIGLVKLLTAWHNNQPSEMHASIKDLVVGAAFVGLALIISPALSALGL